MLLIKPDIHKIINHILWERKTICYVFLFSHCSWGSNRFLRWYCYKLHHLYKMYFMTQCSSIVLENDINKILYYSNWPKLDYIVWQSVKVVVFSVEFIQIILHFPNSLYFYVSELITPSKKELKKFKLTSKWNFLWEIHKKNFWENKQRNLKKDKINIKRLLNYVKVFVQIYANIIVWMHNLNKITFHFCNHSNAVENI